MSTIAVDNARPSLGGTSAPLIEGLLKGHVQFDGSAGTLTASVSLNVASLTDDGSGTYDVNLTNSMDIATPTFLVDCEVDPGVSAREGGVDPSVDRGATTTRVTACNFSGTATDAGDVNVMIAGNLA